MNLLNCWESFKNGDENGFHELYKILWKRLFNYAARLLQDKEEAKDLIQELFSQLWIKRGELSDVKEVESYLFICVKRSVLNHFKSSQIKDKHIKAFAQANCVADDDNIYHILHEKETHKLVLNKLETLPDRMREVFYLNRIQNMEVKQVAKQMNISEQTVRNQLNIASKRLRSVITLLFLYIIH